jgi:hypothetical protein
MLIDSEEPLADVEATWHHLKSQLTVGQGPGAPAMSRCS